MDFKFVTHAVWLSEDDVAQTNLKSDNLLVFYLNIIH